MIAISVAVSAVFLLGIATGVFVVLVIGIHMDERRSAQPASGNRTRVERGTRRILSVEVHKTNQPINKA